ncbi:urease accessory protein UreD [Congregibacter litoralis]|uniref:Urease accessory protein UreD n=1 Tax=Congregibacter litoralis KT71 TaxID=314285 RepID=A4A368_9GAMM|nr:urease accessory protein UreD [Congregibacter litoralis]EAQ99141.1 Urease accessory protein UreH [Congregibacter litoralis KT71]
MVDIMRLDTLNTPQTPQSSEAESSKPLRQWRAQLDLSFRKSAGLTRFAHCAHEGPLRVQRLFHPEPGGKAHCYLLHPPGGVVLGDDLQINIAVKSGEALVTTPAAGRFYTVDQHREVQRQSVNLLVDDDACLEWVPQETILFNGVNAELDTRIELQARSRLVFWDVVVLGRPACDEAFTRGRLKQRLEISRKGRPLLIERLSCTAGDRLSQAAMGMQGQSTVGIMVLTDIPAAPCLEDWLRAVNPAPNQGAFTVTHRGELVIARYLGDDAQHCRAGFARLWRAATEDVLGVTPATPRIWHT